MLDDLRQQAMYTANQAVADDQAGNLLGAMNNYKSAANILLNLADISKTTQLKNRYIGLAESYISRCYQLKDFPLRSKFQQYVTNKTTIDVLQPNSGQKTENSLLHDMSDFVVSEQPNVRWDYVIGLEPAKTALKESLILPMLRPEWFKGVRKPWRGILLFGPPGCGKTLIARAAASEINALFINVDFASVFSKWVGESEKRIRMLFDYARANQPSVIFIDEIDAIATIRGLNDEIGVERRVKTQLMTLMDGLLSNPNERVMILAATNVPWELDQAIRRRFERRILVPPPNVGARFNLFNLNTQDLQMEDINFKHLSNITEGYTGADISLICREASMMPIREITHTTITTKKNLSLRPIKESDFINAINRIEKSIDDTHIQRYHEWSKKYRAG